jgi:drug/metabolite transporter (DMT)-like permease
VVFLFLPVLGPLVFAEQLGRTGWIALGLIVVGIALLPLAAFDKASVLDVGRHLRSRAVVIARSEPGEARALAAAI